MASVVKMVKVHSAQIQQGLSTKVTIRLADVAIPEVETY